ncbi:MAG: MATE family efflux transporter [Candidatus Aegiribacteria sp.]|nr:MATE family efflux transporter [Candidatus Aegiribacteria sp.]
MKKNVLSAADRTRLLGTQSIGRLLIRLSGPAITGMLVQSMYNLVDTIFVGKGVGTLALAALAVCLPIQIFLLAVSKTVGIGAASIISRLLGAGNEEEAGRIAGGSFVLVAFLGLGISLCGLIFLDPVLKLFGASSRILPYARDYLSIIFIGGTFFSVTVCSNNIARSEGNARVAMISMLVGAGTNIILDPIFIFALNMGIRGAAIATVTGQFFAFVWITRYFFTGRSHLKFDWKHLIPKLHQSLKIMQIGSSSFARIAGGSLMAIVVNNTIMHYGHEMHLAVLGVTNRMLIFALMPLFGLVQGLQPVVGYNYGAGYFERVKKALKYALISATVLTGAYWLLFQLAPRFMLGLFSNDENLISSGAGILRILVLMMPVVGFQVIAAGTFQSLGKAGIAFILSISRQILFLIPLALLLPLAISPPLTGVWAAFPSADFLAACVTAIFFIRVMRNMRESALLV